MRFNSTQTRTRFAGLDRQTNTAITDRAESIAGFDAEAQTTTTFSEALRKLRTADTTDPAWKVPATAVKRLTVDALAEFNEAMEDVGIQAYQAKRPGDDEPSVFVTTDRYQAFYSPDVVLDWLKDNLEESVVELEDGTVERRDGMKPSGEWDGVDRVSESYKKDALWHIPTNSSTITNPGPIYGPLEEAIREEGLEASMFGEVRETHRGGEVHMDILFDRFTLEFGADADSSEGDPSGGPIVLGIRTGYDFFGDTKLYAEGFAQDTSCDNSIRSLTDRKKRRAVGDVVSEVREWWLEILREMGAVTDHLMESIEVANGINVDVMEIGFSTAFDHDDDLLAFYQLAGFPDYISEAAVSDVQSRAADPFEPAMWDLHSGATYALTHEYTGDEDTPRERELMGIANDLLLNPSLAADTVEREHQSRLRARADDGAEQGTFEGKSVHATVERFSQDLEAQKEEFETRQDRLRQAFVEAE